MNYKQLTLKERFFIEKHYSKKDWTMQEMANMLNRDKSTISREISRNKIDGIYNAELAQKKFEEKAWHKHSHKLSKYKIFNDVFLKWFDKRKCGVETTYLLISRMHKEGKYQWHLPSQRTVYTWINNGNWIISRKDTLRGKYRKGGKRTGGYMNHIPRKYMLPIWLRPKKIGLRKEFGHWEADLVVGLKRKGHSSLLTMVERKTRKTIIERVRSKSPRELYRVTKFLIEQYNLPVKSITIDNGFEFANYGLLAYQKGFKVYQCDPFASHQRGTNERINGDIRRWYPKGTDFNELTILDVENLERNLNTMRRHIFNLKTAEEIYVIELERYFKSIGRSWALAKRKYLKSKNKRVI